MLSRTADNLYWMARYVERAENMARLLDVSYRLSQLTGSNGHTSAEWRTALSIAGQLPLFLEKHNMVTASNVIAFVALDQDNQSSIVSCLHQARESARAERGVIPSELFESLNSAWLELREANYTKVVDMGFRAFFDWVKERSHLFRGISVGTMVRGDSFCFNRLGTFVERADNTARLLDVKYNILIHEANDKSAASDNSTKRRGEIAFKKVKKTAENRSNNYLTLKISLSRTTSLSQEVTNVVDYYQWGALLRSVSGFKAYRTLYRDTIQPQQVTELLIFRHEFPRSLHACYDDVQRVLEHLCGCCECTRLAGIIHANLHFGRVIDIRDLHSYLSEFITSNSELSDEIRVNFMMVRKY